MRIRALALRIIRQFWKGKRTLALMLVAPLLVLTLVKLVLDVDEIAPRIGVTGAPAAMAETLAETGAEVTVYDDVAAAMRDLEDLELDAVVALENGRPRVTLEGSSPTRNAAVMRTLQQAMRTLVPGGRTVEPAIAYLHGSENRDLFDFYGSMLVGFFSFFFVFIVAGVSFLRERTSGTLQRLLATPLRRWEVVAGYLLGFGLFTAIQATIVVWFATRVLDIALEGSFGLVLLANLFIVLSALTLGTLMSAFANNEFQVFQFIPLVVVPQIFFCGLIDLETMPEWLQTVGHALPLYYGANAMQAIMLRGAGWSDIAADVAVLVGFSLAFALLNVFALRKHRAI